MSNLQRAINDRIDAFVADITNLAKKAALEILESGLSDGRGDKSLGVVSRLRRKSGKRTPEEIQQAADELLNYIKDNPGQRMEAIAKSLGSTTKDLTLPIKKLLQQGMVRVEGQKRATSYFLSGGKAPKAPSGKKRGRPRKKKA